MGIAAIAIAWAAASSAQSSRSSGVPTSLAVAAMYSAIRSRAPDRLRAGAPAPARRPRAPPPPAGGVRVDVVERALGLGPAELDVEGPRADSGAQKHGADLEDAERLDPAAGLH